MGAVRRHRQRRRRGLTPLGRYELSHANPRSILRGFSFAGIGWITGAACFHLESRDAMTDRRPLLRAIFDAAVAAAHPEIVLSAHLRPAPKGRVICLAAGKAAGAMAAAAERHYLDELGLAPSRLSGIATTRHGHGRANATDQGDRSRPPGAGRSRAEGCGGKFATGADCRGRRSPAGAVVGRRFRELDSSGGRSVIRAEATDNPGTAALRRSHRRGQHRSQASFPDQGRPARARRPARRDRDPGDIGRSTRRRFGDRIGTDGAGSDHARRCARHRREIWPGGRRRHPPCARRRKKRELQTRRSSLRARAIRADRAAEGFARRRDQGSERRGIRDRRSRRRSRRRSTQRCCRSRATCAEGARRGQAGCDPVRRRTHRYRPRQRTRRP